MMFAGNNASEHKLQGVVLLLAAAFKNHMHDALMLILDQKEAV